MRYFVKTAETMPFDSDRFKAYVRRSRFYALSFWDVGNLRYFRLDPFNVQCVALEDIVSMTEVTA